MTADARACALDLLAADARMTWAFEVAATAPDVARADEAMCRIAVIGSAIRGA